MSKQQEVVTSELIVRENGQLHQVGPFSLSATGLQEVVGQPSFEEWQRAYGLVKLAESSVMWWIGDLLNYAEKHYGETYTKWVEATEYAEQTLKNAKWVAGAVELSARADNLPFKHHEVVAPLPVEDQERWLAAAEEDSLSVADLRKAIRQEKIEEAAAANPLPEGKYRVLYADPPWKYGDELIEGYGAATHHYPTLTVEELCNLHTDGRHVRDLPADNAVLFLWATVPVLPDSLQVVEAWGFTYKTLFVWDKVRHNYGHYNSVRAELLLVATRGSCLPDSNELLDSVITLERSDVHSEKPEDFRKLIDTLYSAGLNEQPENRVELFARKTVSGWKTWGNEVADGDAR